MGHKNRIAAFDIDDTLYGGSLFLDLVAHMVERKMVSSRVIEEANGHRTAWEHRQGSYDAYVGEQVRVFGDGHLRDVSEADVIAVAKTLCERHRHKQFIFTRELLRTLHDLHYRTIALSGSPKHIVDVFAREWGFHAAVGTEYEIVNGFFTGNEANTKLHLLIKHEHFRRLSRELACDEDGSIAIGNSGSDLPMLLEARYPIAFCPQPSLEREARLREIPVVKEVGETITILQTMITGHCSPIGGRGFVEVGLRHMLPPDVAVALFHRLQNAGASVSLG